MQTMLLDTQLWDLVVDNRGNIAVASDPYSQAQDAASVIKLFEGEAYYDITRGLPYFDQVLGQFPLVALLKRQWVDAAKTVPGVVAAQCFLRSVGKDRVLRGQVQITNKAGAVAGVNF